MSEKQQSEREIVTHGGTVREGNPEAGETNMEHEKQGQRQAMRPIGRHEREAAVRERNRRTWRDSDREKPKGRQNQFVGMKSSDRGKCQAMMPISRQERDVAIMCVQDTVSLYCLLIGIIA